MTPSNIPFPCTLGEIITVASLELTGEVVRLRQDTDRQIVGIAFADDTGQSVLFEFDASLL